MLACMCAHIFACIMSAKTGHRARPKVFYACGFVHVCPHECVTNGWGPLVEPEGVLWVKRATEKEK